MRALTLLCVSLLACNGDVSNNGTGDGGPSGDGNISWKDGNDKPDYGAPKECVPACTPPQICSFIGVCIDPGTCAHDADCAPGMICDPTTKTCKVEDECGSKKIEADAVPPNLLLVLDRSCSMKKEVGGVSKWKIAVDAINKLLQSNAGKIRFGLSLFPDTTGTKCSQDAIAVPPAAGTEGQIEALLTAALQKSDPNWPDGPCVTNIDTAMEQAAAAPELADTTRDNFVALITDGKQYGCNAAGGDSGTTQIITDLLTKGVATFVVGFGGGVDPKQLDIFAQAGGKPNSSDPQNDFYMAEDQASLDLALAAIAKKTMGCVYKLDQVPPTLDKIYVFFDGLEIPQDTTKTKGWDYDATSNTITFYGQPCKDLEGNKVANVDIVYGCKKPSVDAGPGGDGGGCAPGVTPCSAPKDCPEDHACLSGCCTRIIN